MYYQEVEAELDDGVDKLQVDGLLGLSEERAEGVEKGLETHPDKFPEGCAEQFSFQVGRNIRVDGVLTLVLKTQ